MGLLASNVFAQEPLYLSCNNVEHVSSDVRDVNKDAVFTFRAKCRIFEEVPQRNPPLIDVVVDESAEIRAWYRPLRKELEEHVRIQDFFFTLVTAGCGDRTPIVRWKSGFQGCSGPTHIRRASNLSGPPINNRVILLGGAAYRGSAGSFAFSLGRVVEGRYQTLPTGRLLTLRPSVLNVPLAAQSSWPAEFDIRISYEGLAPSSVQYSTSDNATYRAPLAMRREETARESFVVVTLPSSALTSRTAYLQFDLRFGTRLSSSSTLARLDVVHFDNWPLADPTFEKGRVAERGRAQPTARGVEMAKPPVLANPKSEAVRRPADLPKPTPSVTAKVEVPATKAPPIERSMIGDNHAIRVPESTRPDAVTAKAGAARVAPFSDRFRQGITLAGPDYMRLAARSAQECQQACNGEAACKAWTWEHAKATCGLKSGTGPSVANACCTSGVK